MLYTIIIRPLELLFELIFSQAMNIIRKGPGVAIIVLSLIINILVLPLYNRADKMQEEENQKAKSLEKGIKHIKETFSGDERVMMLNTYYRQNDYSPLSALKGSMSLLLEIPFFIAAYNFLSKLELLKDASFGPIRDLGAPDAMFTVGGFVINVLPILMTVINLISASIYTKNSPLKTKIQLLVMALFFLVFLYDSPSGLVFYWTLNNVFSLCKNIVLKMKNPKGFMLLLCTLMSPLSGIFFFGIRQVQTPKAKMVSVGFIVIFLLPLLFKLAKPLFKNRKPFYENFKSNRSLYVISALLLFVIMGLLIPSSVISSSPVEFVNFSNVANPNKYVFNCALIAAGFFLLWMSVFYYLTNDKYKGIFEYGLIAVILGIIIDYMVFGKNQSMLNATLIFDTMPAHSVTEYIVNILCWVAIIVVAYLLFRFGHNVVKYGFITVLCAFIIMTSMNLINTTKIFNNTSFDTQTIESHKKKYISLSKNHENVIVFMLDRGMGPYVKYIFQEFPDIAEKWKGFTFYPNSVSFGIATNFGAPGLYGGYEYIPQAMNERDDMLLPDKHNEALKMMPTLFDNNGYDVTVLDPPYAGYSNLGDLKIYDDLPNVKKYNLKGFFSNVSQDKEAILQRNLFVYSLYKASPLVLQESIYDHGNYNNNAVSTSVTQIITDQYHATGNTSTFNDNYYEMLNINNITGANDSDKGTFLLMCSELTHEPNMLQLPEYLPSREVDNSAYPNYPGQYVIDGIEMKMETIQHVIHYQVNVLAFRMLGEWFDYLRELGVWDNTKIVLASDHSRYLKQFDQMYYAPNDEDLSHAMCLLMVKDFNSNEFKIDDTFMTNADVPTLACEDVIENPVNPYTGKPIESADKSNGVDIFFSYDWNVYTNNGYKFHPGPWYHVKGNAFDSKNWEYLGVW